MLKATAETMLCYCKVLDEQKNIISETYIETETDKNAEKKL